MKPIEAPKWNGNPGAPQEFGPPAQNLKELAEHIEEAHKALQDCRDFTDPTTVSAYSEADGKRLTRYSDSSLCMILFGNTVAPVMRVLYSSRAIQDKINEELYHDLMDCLRFARTAIMSGDAVAHGFCLTSEGIQERQPDDPDWCYRGDIRPLIESLRKMEILTFPICRFNGGMKKDIRNLLETGQLLCADKKAANIRAKKIRDAMKVQSIPVSVREKVHKRDTKVVFEYEGRVEFIEEY